MTDIRANCFRNKHKDKDSQPDYRGTNKEQTIEVAIWIKKDKNGNDYLSVSVKDRNTNYIKQDNHQDSPQDNNEKDNDTLPF